MTKTVQVRITGQVQGVGYRAWTEQAARSRSLGGWVRNRRDGSVEMLISGANDKVDDMLAHLWIGPTESRVERVDAEQAHAPMQLGFRTLPTA
jgi:acylphosphatase